eukprot:TRINITY_DN70406_c0_g1_i1.p1 TRINITY_DN70406_c0_g1~~TRINITY_DN70406_c0_g1_i1.p1  ORF type:complete len:472 (-),score=158.97 TRINITY_DN70406_c0_g1_i1:59-1474(-)
MGRRKFAKNPENVRHFKLMSRSSADACADDPESTPLVLEPIIRPGDKRRTGLSAAELLQIPESLQSVGADVFGLGEKRVDDQDEAEGGSEDDEAALDDDCYFPKDGYNYEQHLKRVSGAGKGKSVVGVVIEAPVKVDEMEFAKPVPITTEEAELMRALEVCDEYEELEEEDLDQLAPGGLAVDEDVLLWGPTAAESRETLDLGAFKAAYKAAAASSADADGDSAVVGGVSSGFRGAAGDDGLEDCEDFDDFLADEYGDDQIGECEELEVEGYMPAEKAEEVLDEYLNDKMNEEKLLHSMCEPVKGKYDDVPRVIDETKAIIERHYHEVLSGDEEETCDGADSTDDSRQWDCETVLSTLSNLSNRPGKIGKIKIIGKKKEELPSVAEDVSDNEGGEDESSEDVIELPEVITERKKGETPEERRLRKNSVKEMRRVCRRMKKESKEMYKTEAAKLPGNQATADVKSKLRVQKL